MIPLGPFASKLSLSLSPYGVPHPSPPFVQPDDILYALSRDILYTPARGTLAGGSEVMAWKTMDVHEQRVRFVVEATQRLKPFSALCAEYDISRPTGYLWLRRYRDLGVQGIAEQSRKPQRSPRRTEPALEQQVVQLRRKYPDWGARKLRVLLMREGVDLPRNTIHNILLRHDLVRAEDQHTPAVQRFERGRPNELWQMDFKGPKNWPQPVGPLSVLDDHSRYLITLAANGSTHGEPVRERLEESFQR
jgi:transposase